MKNKILKILTVILLLPVMFFTGCNKNKPLPAIDLDTYLEEDITITYYQLENPLTLKLSALTSTKFSKDALGKYSKFELNTNGIWTYKMFVETISFYVYTNISSTSEMIINVSITNMAEEKELLESTDKEPKIITVNEQCTFIPEGKKSTKCTFKIGKTFANATGAKITIDILNSLELFDNNGEDSGFEWTIYGLEIHGESRAY